MSSPPVAPRGLKLAPREYLFLGLTILFWAGFVVALGKDTSWDFRNYHWYLPYAFLNHRLGFDVAVAHLATYYNPSLDIPFYLLARHTPSWFALGLLGAVQGSNVVPLYFIGRQSLTMADNRLAAGALALLGQTGALTLSMFGTAYYDNVVSVMVFSGLAVLVVQRDLLREGPLWRAALPTGVAGLVTGMAFGLKLPEMPFALGFAGALVALGGGWRHQGVRLLAGGLGGLIGFALFAVWWMLRMDALTGNPVFPYFNEVFHSSLALSANYRDLRFVPTHFWRVILFPFLFSIDWHVADDLGFQDIRVALAYVTLIPALIIWALGRQSRDPLVDPRAALPVIAFSAVSYIVWLRFFAIYRYIILLEMLGPLLVAIAIGMLPLSRRTRYVTLAFLFAAMLVAARSDFLERAPLGDPYIQVALPPILHPDKTMVVMTGDAPLGFIAPSLPPAIPILRIDGWLVQPKDGTAITKAMKARVAAQLAKGGEIDLIADATDMARAHTALSDYDLAIRWSECQQFDTNLVGLYEWCPLARKQ